MTLPALPGTPPRTDTEAGVLTFVRSEPTAPCPVTCGQHGLSGLGANGQRVSLLGTWLRRRMT